MSDSLSSETTAIGALASRLSRTLGVCAIVTVITPAYAADPRAVVELFTSQGCSSCPPADKVLGELAKDPSVIALSLPIDYWDYLGWKDTLADSRFSARQKAYSHMRGDRGVYTPQVVVNGTTNVLGSDRAAIENAANRTQYVEGVMAVPVTMTQTGGQIRVSVAEVGGKSGEIWICAVSKSVPITIARGENRGQQIHVSQRGSQHAEGRRLERQGRKLDRAAGKYQPRRHRCRCGLRAGRQSRQAWPDAGRGLHLAELKFPINRNDCALRRVAGVHAGAAPVRV